MKEEQARARLLGMLGRDKEELNEQTRRAALAEFTRVANEYFEPKGEISFRTEKSGEGLEVSVSFHAVRVKNFSTLP